MTDRSPLDNELLWLAVAVGAFSATVWVYLEIGFVPSFAPLLVGIFALRRYLAVTTMAATEQSERPTLLDRYGVEPGRDYSDEERVEILSDVRDEYGKKRLLWGAVAVASAVVGALFVPLSVAVTLLCGGVAAYSAHRTYQTHRLVSRIEARLGALGGR